MLEAVGKIVKKKVNSVVMQSSFFCRALATFWTEKNDGKKIVLNVIFKQVLFTGVEATKIIIIIALILGAASIVQIITLVPRVGGESYIGPVLVAVVVRELGPLITAFIIIGRSGTAIATELGNMMVNNEPQALESMGIDPLRFIVLPRIIGVTTAAVGLGLLFSVVALLGGYGFSRFLVNYPFVVYLDDLGKALSFWDVVVGFIKCASFGVIIATMCSYYGFNVKVSSHEVPQMMIKAAVGSIYACFIVNIFITVLFYI